MANYLEMSREELVEEERTLQAAYKAFQNMGLKLNMARGKPGPHQMDLAMDLFKTTDYTAADGTDARNYGNLEGLYEARQLFGDVMGVKPENVFVGGNSSLQLMYFLVSIGYTFGFPESPCPWSQVDHPKFLCPVPGYDRHFRITEEFGIDMINIPMTPEGPDMDMVEKLVAEDPTIKGIWCVPQYSNPDGYTYSDETVRRFAAMKTAAPDFKIFWDEAYIVHHLTDEIIETPVLLEESKAYGNEDRVFMFTSTSKITFPGAGVSALACSDRMMKYVCKRFEVMIPAAPCPLPEEQGRRAGSHGQAPPPSGALLRRGQDHLCPAPDPLRRHRPLDQPQGRLLYQPVCDARLRQAGGPAVQGGRPGADRRRRSLPLRQGPRGFPPAHRAHLSQPERGGAGL